MAANTNPIYSQAPDIQWPVSTFAVNLTGANTSMDGSGPFVYTAFVADTGNGGFVRSLRFKAGGTNVATVARIFINNSQTNASGANNCLFGEITLAATTASANSALPDYEYPMNLALPSGWKINVTLGTAVATGYYISAIAGKY